MRKSLSAILLAALVAAHANAQKSQGNYNYYLPKTQVRVALLIERTAFTPGMLADYAGQYFKTDAQADPSVSYRIVGATLYAAGVPDTTKQFALEIDKKHSILSIDCDRNGVLRAINTKGQDAAKPAPFKPARKSAAVDPNDYMSQEILASGNRPKMARLVAQEIYDIRDSRNQLSRGEAEFMPKDGEQLRIMMAQLDRQEQALMQVFEGASQVDTTEATIAFTPDKEQPRQMAFRFSKHYGLTANDDLSGAPYYAVVTDEESMAEAPEVDPEAKKHKDDMQLGVSLPGKIRVELTDGRNTIATAEFYAAQYGRVEMLDGSLFGKKLTSQLVIDQATGAVTSLKTQMLE